METGGDANFKPRKIDPETDLYTICYTSGTTGLPKGVKLTHKALVATITGIVLAMGRGDILEATEDDVFISYLPLFHILERTVSFFTLSLGASVGFYGGNIAALSDDMKMLKPTIFFTVPQLLEIIKNKADQELRRSAFKRVLFNVR